MPTVTYPGRPLASYPVLSLVYKVLYTGTIAVRLPIWVISYSLFRRARPVSTWSFKQAIRFRVISEVVYMVCHTETPWPLSLQPGKEKDRWEVLQPFPNDVYRGPLEPVTIEPAVIGGTWYPKKPSDPANAPPMVLHIHGGAFVHGDGRTGDSGYMFSTLIEHGKVNTVFAPQYRLACRPTSAPFPAALQDTLTSYLHLVRTLGIPASKITLSGDSAGGNLVIALLRYLAEYGEELGIPQPKNAVVMAPWVSPTKHLWPDIAVTSNPNFHTDYIGTELCRWGAKSYIPDGMAEHPYIMPLGKPFKTPVPIIATMGEVEILGVDIAGWIGEMRRVEGNVIESHVEKDAPHDTMLVGEAMGFQESSAATAERIGEFIREHS